MKELLKIIRVLTIVCVLCAFFLSFTHMLAKEKIEFNAKKRIEDAITNLAPLADEIKEIQIENETIYELFDKNDKLIGYAFLAAGQGYQGKIKIMTVIDRSLKKLTGIEVVESIETPGLGAKIKESSFKNQFGNLTVSKAIECVKGQAQGNNQIEAITGATVSSRAVVNILNKRIEELRKQID